MTSPRTSIVDDALRTAQRRGYGPGVIDFLLDIRNAIAAADDLDALEAAARNS